MRPAVVEEYTGGATSVPSRGPAATPRKELPRNCSRECRLDSGTLGGFDQGVSQRLRPAGHLLHHSVTVLLFVVVHAPAHVCRAVLEHRVDEPGELVGGGRDRFWGAQPGLHPAEERANGTLAVVESRRRQSQRGGRPVGTGLGPPTQDLAPRDLLVRTEAQPRGAVFHGRPATHVQANLAEDNQGRRLVNALDLGQVHPRHPVQGLVDSKGGLVPSLFAWPCWWGQRLAVAVVGEG